MPETEQGFYIFQKMNNETVKIGWKIPEAKNIVCCLCMDQKRLTCCGTKKLLAKHVLNSHPEVLKA